MSPVRNVETLDPPATAAEIVDRIDELELPDATPEEAAQLEAGKDAAKAMIESGALGDTGPDGKRFAAAIALLAYPDHEAPEGEPNDRITVEVRQVRFEAPPEPQEAEEGEETAQPEQEAAPA